MNLAAHLSSMQRRLMLMVGRGTLNLTDDGQGQQRMQVNLLAGETRDNVDRIQPYGLSSHPAPGGTAIVVCLGGSRDHPVCIAVDEPRARPTGLSAGEVVLWSAHGQRVLLREDHGIELTVPDGPKVEMTPDGKVIVDAVEVVMKASARVRMETPALQVTGTITAGAP